MVRVLVTDGMDKQALADLRQQGFDVTEQHYESEELGAALTQYDAVVIRSSTKIRACHIEQAKGSRLKLIIRGGVGVDNIDCDCAKANGIAVRNTPRASSRSVAELALAHLLSCCRFVSDAGYSMREDQWKKKDYSKGMEIGGKTLGIIGFGRIGRTLGGMATALGMKVLAVDAYPMPEEAERIGARYVELDELLANADFISVHTPAVPGKPLICEENIAKMKDGVIIVNTSRGTNVDEDALLAALDSGKVRGAGLDVYMNEPKPNHALFEHPNVSCTPHIGAQTTEAQRRIGEEIVAVLNEVFGAQN